MLHGLNEMNTGKSFDIQMFIMELIAVSGVEGIQVVAEICLIDLDRF